MAEQSDLDNALSGLRTEVANDFKSVSDQLTALQEQIANMPNPSTALDAAVASVNQLTAELHAKYAPTTEEQS